MRTALLVGMLFALIGCGGSQAESTSAQSASARNVPAEGMGHGDAMACPMMLEGAEVSVEDTEQGAALTFTTDRAEDVDALRERVRAMAERHEQRAETRQGRGGRAMPPSMATISDVPNGARIELWTDNPADVDAIRQHAFRRAERMQSCPLRGERPA